MNQFSLFSSSGLCSWFAHNVGTDDHHNWRIKLRNPPNSHLISLELAHHVDQDAAVEHRVAVDRGHVVSNFLIEGRISLGWACNTCACDYYNSAQVKVYPQHQDNIAEIYGVEESGMQTIL